MKLFTPGPVELPAEVRGPFGNIHHRSPEFDCLLQSVSAKLKSIVNASDDYASVIFNATGTGAMEAVVSAVVPFCKSLFLSNGYFGNRLESVARRYSNLLDVYTSSHYTEFDISQVENLINQIKPDFVFLVHHETRTALLNDLNTIVGVCRSAGAEVVVDCTSSIVSENLDLHTQDIGLMIYSSAKGLRSLPGLSFVTGKHRIFSKLDSHSPSFYFDLFEEYKSQSLNNCVRFAQAPHLYAAADIALTTLQKEGVANRRISIRKRMERIREWASTRNLEPLIPYHISGSSCTTFHSPLPYDQLNAALQELGCQLFYGESSGHLQFQVSTMGDLSDDDISHLLASLDIVLGRL